MAIKEIPINTKVYYKLFIRNNKQKLEDSLKLLEELEEDVEVRRKNILSWIDVYINEFNFNPNQYIEFENNEYTTGRFYKAAKGLLINKQNDYELVGDLFNLYELASKQKEIYDLKQDIVLFKKCIALSLKEYTEILRVYYTEVHKHLVLEGEGYVFSGELGWICVNRCVIDKKHPILDYSATKKREKELIEKGERIYNKEEADWCLRNGIEYKAKDKRVFICNEYCYQIPLIDCKLPNARSLEFKVSDYRHRSCRGKTNDELIELCNRDIKKICELPVDLKTKVTLCDKVNKILYTKFIRNENQKPFTFTKTNR
ncbi:MAG: hypothetical protein ACI4VC_03815 [Clostridia bacterium]